MPKGPVPKRASQRSGHGAARKSPDTVVAKVTPAVEPPAADPEWHPVAIEWFESLGKSGQSSLYEPSDWATARVVAEFMDRALRAGRRIPSALVATLMAMQKELLTTESARRACRIVLERGDQPAEDPKVAIMDHYRSSATRTSA